MFAVFNEEPTEEDLEHFGVKGMKWGVRRKAKQTIKDFKRDSQFKAQAYQYSDKRITKDQYEKLSDKDSILARKGDTINRIGYSQNENLKKNLYATNNKSDNAYYKNFLVNKSNPLADKYQMHLKVNDDLVSPSDKKLVDSYISLLSKNVKYNGSTYKVKDLIISDEDKAKAKDDFELGLNTYKQFTQIQGNSANPVTGLYFNSLKNKGYNSIKDKGDEGLFTKTPMIIFGDKTKLDLLDSHKISEKEKLESAFDMRKV